MNTDKQSTALQLILQFIEDMKITQTLLNGCDIETVHIPSLIHKATELLEVEKQQHGDTHYDGQKCAGCKHPSGHDALAYFTTTFKQ